MRQCADYVVACKAKLGKPRMSDRELGELLGYTQQNIARAKAGYMTDPMAMRIANLLGIEAGEVLIVARAERENDQAVKDALVAYVGKIAGLLPQLNTHDAIPAGVLVAGHSQNVDVAMFAQKRNAPMVSRGGASIGGEGRFRSRRYFGLFAGSKKGVVGSNVRHPFLIQ